MGLFSKKKHEPAAVEATTTWGAVWLRRLLLIAGGALVMKGYLSDTELEMAVTAILTLGTLLWSIAKRKHSVVK